MMMIKYMNLMHMSNPTCFSKDSININKRMLIYFSPSVARSLLYMPCAAHWFLCSLLRS